MGKTKEFATGLVQLKGADIYYEVRGAGPPVLFIHGGGWTRIFRMARVVARV